MLIKHKHHTVDQGVDSLIEMLIFKTDTSDCAVKSKKAVSAYFTSKQILPFGFAEQYHRRDWLNKRLRPTQSP